MMSIFGKEHHSPYDDVKHIHSGNLWRHSEHSRNKVWKVSHDLDKKTEGLHY